MKKSRFRAKLPGSLFVEANEPVANYAEPVQYKLICL